DINITEPGYRDRINEPMNGYLTFEDQTCYNDTLRVLNYNGSAWIEYPVALWNTTWHASGYIEATSYTHAVNISQSDTETYYVYYSNINLGSPSYDYYPFEYIMYILSDLKLSAYYDDTDYQIFKWDYDNEVWDEPSDLNPYWIPSEETGTLDEDESYSKIEDVNSPTHTFVGIYRVQSTKPITVAGGGLDGNAANRGNGYTTHVDGLGFGNATRYHISVFYGTASGGTGYKTHVYIQSLEDGNEVSVRWQNGSTPNGFTNRTKDVVSTYPVSLDAGEYIEKGQISGGRFFVINSTKPVTVISGDHDALFSRDVRRFVVSTSGSWSGKEFYSMATRAFKMTNLGSGQTVVRIYNATTDALVYSQTLNQNETWQRSISTPSWWSTGNYPNLGVGVYRIESTTHDISVEALYSAAADQGDYAASIEGHRTGDEFIFSAGGRSSRYGKIYIFPFQNVIVDIDQVGGSTYDTFDVELKAFEPYNMTVSALQYDLFHLVANGSVQVLIVDGSFTAAGQPTADNGYGYCAAPFITQYSDNALTAEIGSVQNLYSIRAHIQDEDDSEIENANVTLYYLNGTKVRDNQGLVYSGLSDSNGNVTFEGLQNYTYKVYVWIDTSTWLSPQPGYNSTIDDSAETGISDFMNDVEVGLSLVTLDLHLVDLDGFVINNTNEVFRIRAIDTDEARYADWQEVNGNGDMQFYRLPKADYDFRFYYSSSPTGRTYSFGDFEDYSRNVTESISETWIMGLTTMTIDVIDYTGNAVPLTNVTISNSSKEFTEEDLTGVGGSIEFYRIVNITWTIDINRNDNYGQTVSNSTSHALQSESTVDVEIPLVDMNLRIQTSDPYPLPGAFINLTLTDETPITTGQSNSSGQKTFAWIKNGTYKIYAKSGEQDLDPRKVIRLTKGNFTNVVNITLTAPTFLKDDSALDNLNSTNIYSVYFNDNFTLDVLYYNITGNFPVSSDQKVIIHLNASSLINFTIYHNNEFVGMIYYTLSTQMNVTATNNTVGGGLWVEGNTTFSGLFSTKYLKLNSSIIPYRIVVRATTKGFNTPADLEYWITVKEPTTSITPTTPISHTWKLAEDNLFDYTDTYHGLLIDDADVARYNISTYSGNLINLGNGSYQLSDSILNQLDEGTYSLLITFKHQNYQNKTLYVSVTINPVATSLVWEVNPVNMNWNETNQLVHFNFTRTDNGTTVASPNMTLEWICIQGGYNSFMVPISSFDYMFANNLVPNGTWLLRATTWKTNHVAAVTNSSQFTIQSRPTTITLEPSIDTLTVNWSTDAVFTFWLNATDDETHAISGASIYSSNWTTSVYLLELSNGFYQVSFATDIVARNLSVELVLWKSNYTIAEINLNINILIPIAFTSTYGSSETPLEAYWTHDFTIELVIYDGSRAAEVIENANISYNWVDVGLSGNLTESQILQGRYSLTLSGSNVPPGDTTIELTAQKTGCSSEIFTYHVKILEVPTTIGIPDQFTQNIHVEYETNISLMFNWTNTLDSVGIDSPDQVSVDLAGSNLTTIVDEGNGNYTVLVDTIALGLTAGESYTFTLSVVREGYSTPQTKTIVVIIDVVGTQIDLTLDRSTAQQGELTDLTISVFYNRTRDGSGITGASLVITFNNIDYNMTDIGGGMYNFTISGIEVLPINVYEVEVQAAADNFESQSTKENLVIIERYFQLGPMVITVSQLQMTVVGVVIPLVGLGAVVAYKRITMPYPLKIINKALKAFQKGSSFGTEGLKINTRDATIRELLKEDFEVLGMQDEIETSSGSESESESESSLEDEEEEFQ
ncbi:MAG: carboxypeptidase-like regulatory domain-containing protein, partial [Candidatus Ranarchaeia archaeon]